MAKHKQIVNLEQLGNLTQLTSELDLAHELGQRYAVDTLSMLAVLRKRNALGRLQTHAERTALSSAEITAEDREFWEGRTEVTTAEFIAWNRWDDTRSNRMKAGNALRLLGFSRERRMTDGHRQWIYIRG